MTTKNRTITPLPLDPVRYDTTNSESESVRMGPTTSILEVFTRTGRRIQDWVHPNRVKGRGGPNPEKKKS